MIRLDNSLKACQNNGSLAARVRMFGDIPIAAAWWFRSITLV